MKQEKDEYVLISRTEYDEYKQLLERRRQARMILEDYENSFRGW